MADLRILKSTVKSTVVYDQSAERKSDGCGMAEMDSIGVFEKSWGHGTCRCEDGRMENSVMSKWTSAPSLFYVAITGLSEKA